MKTRRLAGLLALIVGCGGAEPPPVASPAPPPPVDPRVAAATAFFDAVEALGYELPYRPAIREWTRPSLISWREEARAVAVPRWEEVPESTRALFAELAAPEPGPALFDAAFRWFFVPHELAHFLQTELRAPGGSHAAAERWANDLAVAFWKRQPGGPERLTAFRAQIERAVAALPDPRPAGEAPDAWFDANYEALGGDPRRYGALQFRFVRDSLARADTLDFDALVSALLGEGPAPVAVMFDPQRDVGFHVAAHLDLPDVAITLYDPAYVQRVLVARSGVAPGDQRLREAAAGLGDRLNQRWPVHRLVRVPALFGDFEETRAAFQLLLGDRKPTEATRPVLRRLETSFLPLYPDLRRLSDGDQRLARQLIGLIEHEHATFLPAWHAQNREAWDPRRRALRDAWHREIAPALQRLDPRRRVRQVVVVLSPALARHGKSYRILDGIGRVATQLPERPEQTERALLYAFHELCHGVSDEVVFAAGYDREALSYKEGDAGKAVHEVIEAAAQQAMFEALGRTNPALQARFVADFGDLRWLAREDLLADRLLLAGRRIAAEDLQALRRGLERKPRETTRHLYERGLLMPERSLIALRAVLDGAPRARATITP